MTETTNLPTYAIDHVDLLVEYLLSLEPDYLGPIRVQKALYLLFAYYYKHCRINHPDFLRVPKYLFPAEFEARFLGPVIREVHEKFDAHAYPCGKPEVVAAKVFKLDTKEAWRHEVKLFVDQFFLDQVMLTNDLKLIDRTQDDLCWVNTFRDGAGRNDLIPIEEIIREYDTGTTSSSGFDLSL